jgi:predicted heme/steroid binding protein
LYISLIKQSTIIKGNRMKKLILALAGIIAVSSVCAQSPAPASKQPVKADTTKAVVKADSAKADTTKMLELTIKELAKYNGTNGIPAYVAVDGIIYDVTGVNAWKAGKHEGYGAGKDISKEIKKVSPHGTSVLKKRKVVGKIIPEKPADVPASK